MKEINKQIFPDDAGLRIFHCGIENCLPDHDFGPAVRDHYLIHFIFEGRGVFVSESTTHHLGVGQGFLICPNKITYYRADSAHPWHYAWIGFYGGLAGEMLRQAGLDLKNPIINCPTDLIRQRISGYFKDMAETLAWKKGRETRLTGLLHLFLAELAENRQASAPRPDQASQSDLYVSKAYELFLTNYSRKITIGALARQIGLDRSYFGALFRRSAGVSPQQYLLTLRMEKAGGLLLRSSLPVAAVARSVGYEDPLLFSRMFHKIKGVSPSEYRRNGIS